MKLVFKDILLATAVLMGTVVTSPSASAFSQNGLVIENLPTNSAIDESPAQDLLLRSANDGSTYLYVEQQQGTRLLVFDVTNPEHMSLVTSTSIAVHGAYDFVDPVNDGERIAFRDGSGSALLDLHKPKAPRISTPPEHAPHARDRLGRTSSLVSSAAPFESQIETDASVRPRTVQFVKPGRHSRVVASMDDVTRLTERPLTGTVFLLADGNVMILRSLGVELQYEDDLLIPKDPN
jgi:hypothetical protein